MQNAIKYESTDKGVMFFFCRSVEPKNGFTEEVAFELGLVDNVGVH